MNYAIPGLPRKMNFAPGTSLGFLGQSSITSSNVGSVRSGREIHTQANFVLRMIIVVKLMIHCQR